jgi:hypothetical protein
VTVILTGANGEQYRLDLVNDTDSPEASELLGDWLKHIFGGFRYPHPLRVPLSYRLEIR